MKKIEFIIAVIFGLTLFSCTTPKAIENHHHHYEQADTLAIQAQIDAHLKSWHAQIDSSWRQRMEEYSASMTSNEDQKEHITETITTYIDSLGREVRQEQRTTDRSLSKIQQQTEQRLTREFEIRLQQALSQQDSIWQSRYNEVKAHWEQEDSVSNTQIPVAVNEDNRPWYKRWASAIAYILVGAALFAVIYFSRKWWMKLIKL